MYLQRLNEHQVKPSKNGSSLNTECVTCFGAVLIPKQHIQKSTDIHFDAVRQLILEFTSTMHDLYKEGKVAEVMCVQPISFKLFKDMSLIVLSEYKHNLRFENKASCHADTEYSTTLNPPGKIINISGETDGTMLYCDIPIKTWEDKELKALINLKPKEVGQPLAEIRGMGEIFKTRVGVHAPKFCGVLTTGLTWTMSFRTYLDGQVNYGRTELINTWNEQEKSPDTEGIDIVTSLLMTSLRSAEVLIKIINERNKKLSSCEEYYPDTDTWSDGSDADDGVSGGGNGGGGSGDRDRVVKSVSNALSKMSTRNTTSKNSSNKHGKRTPLAPVNTNSIITFENMVKHDNLLQSGSMLCMNFGNSL
jgi:hypothetical protein